MPDASRRVRVGSSAVLLAGGLMLAASPAMAAGFWIYQMGTPDLGTASAGRAALAKDAATVFGNPAGMTSLDGSQLLVSPQLVIGDVHFDRGPDTTVAGGNGGNAAGTIPGGSLYFAHSVTPDIKLGFWSGSYFGGVVQYEDGWSGRYYGTKAELLTRLHEPLSGELTGLFQARVALTAYLCEVGSGVVSPGPHRTVISC